MLNSFGLFYCWRKGCEAVHWGSLFFCLCDGAMTNRLQRSEAGLVIAVRLDAKNVTA